MPDQASRSDHGAARYAALSGVCDERKRSSACPSDIRVEAPNLRIVDEDLAASVDAQRLDRRERYIRKTDGKLLGRLTFVIR